MAKQLIPKELDQLIQEYLTDGVLTNKEREVILRKAEAMNLDRDEIDLYLDAQVQKIDQATDAVIRKQKGKSCPFCGSPVPQLVDKCPECGQFITPEASEELKDILENLEDALVDFKAGKDFEKSRAIVERYVRKAKMYYINHPKIKPLLAEVEEEMLLAEKKAKATSRKRTIFKIISNLWVIFLFLVLIGPVLGISLSNIYDNLSEKENTKKWTLIHELEQKYDKDSEKFIHSDDLTDAFKEAHPDEYWSNYKILRQLEDDYWRYRDSFHFWEVYFEWSLGFVIFIFIILLIRSFLK
ncbi:MAG: hypothetical protein IKP16_04685 [Prevotella sp.]|nr:hypothetical protein [Prevotella sp.]